VLSVSVYIELFLCFKENYKRRILCGLIHVLELSNLLSNKKSIRLYVQEISANECVALSLFLRNVNEF
jgi:hypothetical protein